ncbi:MAG: hypothetical protein KBT36_15230 [Kurthia sp.]|nr:hypothetical protein [Candidatus Kurthia equi]
MNEKCERHNKKRNQVVQDEKLVLYCPECAKQNILSIIQLEDQLEFQKNHESKQQALYKKNTLHKQITLGFIIALYLQVTPWIFSPFFYEVLSVEQFIKSVANGYLWMWTQGWTILVSVFFIILGLVNIIDAKKKLKKLSLQIPVLKVKKKDLNNAVTRFQNSNRLQQSAEYMKKLHKKYVEQKTTITPVEVMTEYELSIYYARLIQHLGYENVKFYVPIESYGINLIAEKDGVKSAFMVIKDARRLNAQSISHLAIGRAYYDCEKASILLHGEASKEMQQFAHEMVIQCWDMKKIEEKLTSQTVDDWANYLEGFLIKSDMDLKKYAIYERERLLHLSELH